MKGQLNELLTTDLQGTSINMMVSDNMKKDEKFKAFKTYLLNKMKEKRNFMMFICLSNNQVIGVTMDYQARKIENGNEVNFIQPNRVVVTVAIENGKVNNMMKYQSKEETGIVFKFEEEGIFCGIQGVEMIWKCTPMIICAFFIVHFVSISHTLSDIFILSIPLYLTKFPSNSLFYGIYNIFIYF